MEDIKSLGKRFKEAYISLKSKVSYSRLSSKSLHRSVTKSSSNNCKSPSSTDFLEHCSSDESSSSSGIGTKTRSSQSTSSDSSKSASGSRGEISLSDFEEDFSKRWMEGEFTSPRSNAIYTEIHSDSGTSYSSWSSVASTNYKNDPFAMGQEMQSLDRDTTTYYAKYYSLPHSEDNISMSSCNTEYSIISSDSGDVTSFSSVSSLTIEEPSSRILSYGPLKTLCNKYATLERSAEKMSPNGKILSGRIRIKTSTTKKIKSYQSHKKTKENTKPRKIKKLKKLTKGKGVTKSAFKRKNVEMCSTTRSFNTSLKLKKSRTCKC